MIQVVEMASKPRKAGMPSEGGDNHPEGYPYCAIRTIGWKISDNTGYKPHTALVTGGNKIETVV